VRGMSNSEGTIRLYSGGGRVLSASAGATRGKE
jgi:hypothetical protein